MRPEVVADENFRAEKQRTHMQVIAPNPALGARALQDLLAAERVVAAAIAADLGTDQTDPQPQVAAAAAVNALRGAFMAWFLSGASGDPVSAITWMVMLSAVTPVSVASSSTPSQASLAAEVVSVVSPAGASVAFSSSLRPQAPATRPITMSSPIHR